MKQQYRALSAFEQVALQEERDALISEVITLRRQLKEATHCLDTIAAAAAEAESALHYQLTGYKK